MSFFKLILFFKFVFSFPFWIIFSLRESDFKRTLFKKKKEEEEPYILSNPSLRPSMNSLNCFVSFDFLITLTSHPLFFILGNSLESLNET